MAARLQDIAAEAGVSVASVSRIMKGPPESDLFKAATVERVMQVAGQLGYLPNYHARALQTGRSLAIGMVNHKPSEQAIEHPAYGGLFHTQMVAGIDVGARARGYQFVSIGWQDASDGVATGLQFLRERRIDALILETHLYRTAEAMLKKESKLPIVLTNHIGKAAFPSVYLDEAPGITDAVHHLAELGHKRLLLVDTERGVGCVAGARREAYRQAVGALGIAGDEVIVEPRDSGNWQESLVQDVEHSRNAILERYKGTFGATGIVCCTEHMGLGAYVAATERGLRVPDDVSVIGFDDMYGATFYPPMTVGSHMLDKIGQKAADLAIDIAAAKGKNRRFKKQHPIKAELVIRQSTAPPK